MAHRSLSIIGAALAMGLAQAAWSYSGSADPGTAMNMDGAGMPLMMDFEATHADTPAARSPAARDVAPLERKHRGPGHADSRGDEFQRYFDRHYRAHLVLDAAAHHQVKVQ